MYGWILALLVLLAVGPAHAQVHVDIGIHLPAPPSLVVVPPVPVVKYVPAPDGPGNFFFYDSRYWVFVNGGWYVGPGYNGPWVVVGPQSVPQPILKVPVEYYHVPPGHWKQWDRRRPPHWDEEWADKGGGKHGDQGANPGRGHGKGHGKGH
jgi:hypothetical protein